MTSLGLLHALPMVLDAADMAGLATGKKLYLVPRLGRTRDQRTRDHSTVALERENTVHRKAEKVGTAAGLAAALFGDGYAKVIHPLPRHGRNREDRRTFKECPLQEVGHVLPGELQHLLIHHIDFSEGHKAMLHTKKRTYFKVFTSLRHNAFISRDDK